jgi:hypothetical protein
MDFACVQFRPSPKSQLSVPPKPAHGPAACCWFGNCEIELAYFFSICTNIWNWNLSFLFSVGVASMPCKTYLKLNTEKMLPTLVCTRVHNQQKLKLSSTNKLHQIQALIRMKFPGIRCLMKLPFLNHGICSESWFECFCNKEITFRHGKHGQSIGFHAKV